MNSHKSRSGEPALGNGQSPQYVKFDLMWSNCLKFTLGREKVSGCYVQACLIALWERFHRLGWTDVTFGQSNPKMVKIPGSEEGPGFPARQSLAQVPGDSCFPETPLLPTWWVKQWGAMIEVFLWLLCVPLPCSFVPPAPPKMNMSDWKILRLGGSLRGLSEYEHEWGCTGAPDHGHSPNLCLCRLPSCSISSGSS